MKLTRQGEYAIRASLELAKHYEVGLITAREIAANQEIPSVFLTKILSSLTKSGLVISQRGNHGGIRLSKTPSRITIKEVIEAVEGPFTLNACLGEAGQCGRKPECKVHQMWQRAQIALFKELEVTLDKLI